MADDNAASAEAFVAALGESLQPPLANGEVVFDAPWQGRVFGMAVALFEQGLFAWSDFQAALIRRVGAWDAQARGGAAYPYYELFMGALDDVLTSGALLARSEIESRVALVAARPHGHDH